MGILNTNVGAMLNAVNNSAAIMQGRLDALNAEAQKVYGVDLPSEIVKSMKYQHMYEAAAMVIKTQDRMIGSLLNIFA